MFVSLAGRSRDKPHRDAPRRYTADDRFGKAFRQSGVRQHDGGGWLYQIEHRRKRNDDRVLSGGALTRIVFKRVCVAAVRAATRRHSERSEQSTNPRIAMRDCYDEIPRYRSG